MITTTEAFKIGQRITALQMEGCADASRVLDLLLAKMVERCDLELLHMVVDELDAIDQDEAHHRAAADAQQAMATAQRAEKDRATGAALSVPCPDCGQPPGERCRRPYGNGYRTYEKPHSNRLNTAP